MLKEEEGSVHRLDADRFFAHLSKLTRDEVECIAGKRMGMDHLSFHVHFLRHYFIDFDRPGEKNRQCEVLVFGVSSKRHLQDWRSQVLL